MNGPQDVLRPWSQFQLQPQRRPGAAAGPPSRGGGRGSPVVHGLRGAVRGAGLHHDLWVPQQPGGVAALLQVQEAPHARQHAAAQHQRQRHAGVRLRHHAQLRLQHPRTVAARPERMQLVRLHQLLLRTLTVYNKRGPDYRKPLLAVGASWLYSLFWTVPPLLGWSSYGQEGAGTSCSVSWTARTAQSHAYIICLFIFCLGLPVLVMIYCYGRLLWAVKQPQVGKIRKTAARRREYHILFMVLTTAACYLLCWMPYGVVAMMATFGPPDIISPVASVVPSLLAKSSTVINPLIYILMNKQFYKCFLILFHCDHWSAQHGNTSMPSKTTAIQLHRRVSSNMVACAAHVSADPVKPCFTPDEKLTTPPEAMT
uniref:teleost multiple tissue opsin 2b isoform X3 n=1 Tax=Doryrhamphus excisus TaxID=161450 RepID=UPI0025AE8F7A|nr:teleost multiple tissue opsin 2b isoform X3 [Doryrhamphus excisus]